MGLTIPRQCLQFKPFSHATTTQMKAERYPGSRASQSERLCFMCLDKLIVVKVRAAKAPVQSQATTKVHDQHTTNLKIMCIARIRYIHHPNAPKSSKICTQMHKSPSLADQIDSVLQIRRASSPGHARSPAADPASSMQLFFLPSFC